MAPPGCDSLRGWVEVGGGLQSSQQYHVQGSNVASMQGLSYCKCEDYNDLPLEDGDQERAVHEMRLKVSQQLVQHHSDAMKDFAVHHGNEPANDVDFSFWTSNFLSQELQKENYLTQSTYERMKAVYDTVMGYAYKEKQMNIDI